MLNIIVLAKKISQGLKIKQLNKKTAKVLLLAILIMAVFLWLTPVYAQQEDLAGLRYAEATGLSTQDIRITIANIIRIFFGLLGLIAVVIIMYGGYIYMTSAGNPEKIDKAKKILIGAVIGLIICLSAFAIAQFVISSLLGELPPWGEGPSPYGGGGGALGVGIIESHYPLRNAIDIPRNTNIVVTFKEPLCAEYIINDNNTPEDLLDDLIDTDSVKIYQRPEAGAEPDILSNVRANYTPDLKTFIFKPLELLGNPNQSTVYVVELTSNIRKLRPSCNLGAFGAFNSYTWSFTVSTVVDLIPPQIVSVISQSVRPEPGKTVPRNSIIQINFNEAINPLTLQGQVLIDGNATVGSLSAENTANFINIYLEPNTNNNQFIGGEFLISNQFKTVEFITTDLCGKNSCGGDVFCLPGDKNIGILAKAATLAEEDKPTALLNPSLPRFYDGIIDMSDNSLDGNIDDTAQGPGTTPFDLNENQDTNNFKYVTDPAQGDNVKWNFNTNNVIDLVPPQIVSYLPLSNATQVDPDSTLRIIFDKYMMSSTLKPNSGYETGEEHITLVQPLVAESLRCGYYIAKEDDPDYERTTAIMFTNGLGENLSYGIRAGSGIKDLTQNCYLPCSDNEYCIRRAGSVPGEYTQGVPWTPPSNAFPTCNLSGTPYGSFGNFNVNYSEGGANKVLNFKAFGLLSNDDTISNFYRFNMEVPASTNVMKHGGFFTQMVAANRVVTIVYFSQSANKYYLVNFYGGLGSSGKSVAIITGGISVAISDDGGETKVTNAAQKIISANHRWVGWMDGEAIYIGDGSADFSLQMNLQSFNVTKDPKCTNETCEWYLFGPEGAVKLTIPGTITINFTK